VRNPPPHRALQQRSHSVWIGGGAHQKIGPVAGALRKGVIAHAVGVQLLSRNGKNFSKKFPQVFSALKNALPV